MLAVRIFALYFLFTLVLCSFLMLVEFGVHVLLAMFCAGMLLANAGLVDLIRRGRTTEDGDPVDAGPDSQAASVSKDNMDARRALDASEKAAA